MCAICEDSKIFKYILLFILRIVNIACSSFGVSSNCHSFSLSRLTSFQKTGSIYVVNGMNERRECVHSMANFCFKSKKYLKNNVVIVNNSNIKWIKKSIYAK